MFLYDIIINRVLKTIYYNIKIKRVLANKLYFYSVVQKMYFSEILLILYRNFKILNLYRNLAGCPFKKKENNFMVVFILVMVTRIVITI